MLTRLYSATKIVEERRGEDSDKILQHSHTRSYAVCPEDSVQDRRGALQEAYRLGTEAEADAEAVVKGFQLFSGNPKVLADRWPNITPAFYYSRCITLHIQVLLVLLDHIVSRMTQHLWSYSSMVLVSRMNQS